MKKPVINLINYFLITLWIYQIHAWTEERFFTGCPLPLGRSSSGKLNVAFKEGLSQVRIENAAEKLPGGRRIVLNLLKQKKTVRVDIESRRPQAEWEHDYLLRVHQV